MHDKSAAKVQYLSGFLRLGFWIRRDDGVQGGFVLAV